MPTRPEDPAYANPRYGEIETAIPNRRLEAWKWTDVRAALGRRPDGLSAALTPEFHDAHVAPERLAIRETQLGGAHALGILFERFGQDAYSVRIPAGEDGGTLTVTSLERGNGAILIVLEPGARLHLVERHTGEPDAFVNADLDIRIGEGAQLVRTVLQSDAASTVRIATARIRMAARAALTQHILATGGALTRFETRIAVEGEGVAVVANGGYLLDGERHADLTTHVALGAPGARVRQSVRGIVSDRARGVFQGKFHVARAAQFTDAEMRHDALLLSERARVRAKPELEIYADDVACAHGNTLGRLDENALFYMRQRGISEARAKALLVEAFLAEAFADAALEDEIADEVATWLARRLP